VRGSAARDTLIALLPSQGESIERTYSEALAEVTDAGASAFFHAEQDWARLSGRPAPTLALPTLVDSPEARQQPVMP